MGVSPGNMPSAAVASPCRIDEPSSHSDGDAAPVSRHPDRPRADLYGSWAHRASPRRALRIALGLLWLLDGALQYQSFMFHKTFVTEIIAQHDRTARRHRSTDHAEAGCPGCSMFVDQIGHLAHFHARDTSLVLVSLAQIESFRTRMGWTIPWYSSAGSDFNRDFGVTRDDGESFGLSVFIRDGERIFHSYFTSARGVEALGSVWTFLDLTPLGRQEDWEDSPSGAHQEPPYQWWRRHTEYP